MNEKQQNSQPPYTTALMAGIFSLASVLYGCGSPEHLDPQRYIATDSILQQAKNNLANSDTLKEIADIDHSRLGGDAGSPMSPARVLIFSAPKINTELVSMNPLVALDLPFRLLAYEKDQERIARFVYSSFDYLSSRYQLDPEATSRLKASYQKGIAIATEGLPSDAFTPFASDEMQATGIISIKSPYDFQETFMRVNEAINAQSDTLHFGLIDFQADARDLGIDIPPSRLILFGAPGPGGKAMADAPTLGLDGFCQKFLVWQDAAGDSYLSFNSLLALAERQGVKQSIALRIIEFRLQKTFKDALAED